MGFHPADDSDLEPQGKKSRKAANSSRGMHQASFDEEYKSSRKGKKNKKKKKNTVASYIWTFVKVFGTTVGIFVIGIGILLYCSMSGLLGDIGQIELQDLTIGTSSEVYYIDPDTGEEIYVETLSDGANRKWVDFEEIPEDMQHAFVSIEDERFYKHSGFDLLRTSKATVMYVWGKVTGGGSDFGGSTITQQLVKNVTGDWENSPARKIKEISQAVNLEKQLTKDEILELYLNVINLSNGCYGVQSASMEFFGKPVDELNLAECASIAGITQNPAQYDPLKNPENNKRKQEIVLSKMLELGYISQAEYEEAVDYKLVFKSAKDSGESNVKINDYYIEYLTQCIVEDFMEMGYSRELALRKTVSGGLKIITTVDPEVQGAIDEIYENPEKCASIFGYNSEAENTPQSAIVVLSSTDGSIKGMSGGLGKKSANLILNRVTIPRQSGSSIKPISVYAPAIDDGLIHASTVYSDNPENFNGWSPKNSYSGGGSKTVQLALQRSSNIIACRILRDYGVEKSYNHLVRHLGITSLVDDDKNLPALALGGLTKGISPLQMAAAYMPFVDGGVYTKPYIYTTIYDREGNVLIKNTPERNQAITSQTAYIMTQLLRRVVTSGTGTAAGLDGGIFTAGKTGTTDDNKDKWFIGFTPNYLCAVWHGYDKNLVVSSHTTGSQIAFKTVMNKIHQGKKINSISAPSGITMLNVCSETGLLASDGCNSISLPYTSDNKPTKYCSHKAQASENEEDGEKIVDIDEDGETENAPREE